MAPSDFCRPIIGTLSLTETNIIFAIPKPPTNIEKLPITQPAILIVANIVETNDDKYSGLFIAKLSSSIGFNPLFALNSPFNSYSKLIRPGSLSDIPFILNTALFPFLPTLYIFLKLLKGIDICLSKESPPPNASPCSF